MSEFVVPDMTEPIVGWRGWSAQSDGLHSLHGNGHWPMKKRMQALCPGTEPTRHNFVGWEAIPPRGDPVWVRDALENENLEPGVQDATGPVYTATSAVWHSVNVMHIEPRPDRPSELLLPRGWTWRIGHRQAIFPPRHTECPGDGCSCGLYAAKSRRGAEGYDGDVIGEVYLWGKVIEGANGYRAQYAYPKKLHTRREKSKKLRAVLLEYGVPVDRKHAPAPKPAVPQLWWKFW